jgi:hypothetical protein
MTFPLFRRPFDDASWSLARLNRPWAHDRISILEFLRTRSDSTEDDQEGADLPDEPWLTDMRSIRFAPGVFDRMMRVNDTPDEAYSQANGILRATRGLSERSTDRQLAKLYHEITRRRLSEVLRILERELVETTFRRPERIRKIALLLIRETPGRDAVKVGLLLLRNVGLAVGDVADVVVVGCHGEFTRLASDAMGGASGNARRFVWEMAKRVGGPGRAAAVLELEGATEPDIKQWLLEEGWRDNNYDESAALVCATTGGLEKALNDRTVSLEAAGGLLQALARAGIHKHEGLRELPNGPQIAVRYCELLAADSRAIWQFHVARSLHLFVASKFQDWSEPGGWTPSVRERIASLCANMLRAPGWEAMAWRDIDSPDERIWNHAYSVAHSLRLDLWDHWWNRAQSDPQFKDWGRLEYWVNAARVDQFLDLARKRLAPLDSAEPWTVGSIAMRMSGFTGKGWDFVRAAMWSPNGVSSIEGLRALGTWGAANWTGEMRAELVRASESLPEQHLREFAQEILRGEWHPPEGIDFGSEPEVWET